MSELLDTSVCDQCGTDTSDPLDCWHGRSVCPECWEYNPCRDCTREAMDE